MSETTGWMDDAYKDAFETEVRGLERRCANDPSCTLDQLKGTLKNLYIFQGNNWDGRGQVFELGLSATIAAYEFFISELEKKDNPARSAKN